ncbi:hypothetical protein BV20DRAFT_1037583 [Pilatotrama ljubarskyi]|nr:hypothetical protein BV20DRAFT_1037583 [Pilatotrama ljubarskyi]
MGDMDDFLSDSAALFGDVSPADDTIRYGPLVLTVAPKANTLLADHLFSPSLLLAELIERGIISLRAKTVVELGAGCALPSLLASTLPEPPSLVAITDYPDDVIMKNLSDNVERNRPHLSDKCKVHACGYEWGRDVGPLLGFDVVIMSDLLHFDGSHDVLVQSLTSLLRHDPSARTYVAAGKYTAPHVCDHFVEEAKRAGILLEEQEVKDVEQLGVRKGMSRWWIGRWVDI